MNTGRIDKSKRRAMVVIIALVVAAISVGILSRQTAETAATRSGDEEDMMGANQASDRATNEAIFAGGCFWCIEAAFEQMPGVIEAISGYTGGHVADPTYEQVSSGTTGHFEAVQVKYDPEQITYDELVDQFWRSIDPTDAGGQFYDRGSQYLTAIFYQDEAQRELAERSKQELTESAVFEEPIVTQILPSQTFYPAEDYHQDYSKTCALHYNAYSKASGRERYLEQTWDDED